MGYSHRRGVPEKEGVAEQPVTTPGEEMLLASGPPEITGWKRNGN